MALEDRVMVGVEGVAITVQVQVLSNCKGSKERLMVVRVWVGEAAQWGVTEQRVKAVAEQTVCADDTRFLKHSTLPMIPSTNTTRQLVSGTRVTLTFNEAW